MSGLTDMTPPDVDRCVADLEAIRGVIASRPIDCLGSGQGDNGLAWPIRDEVVDGLTRTINAIRALRQGGEPVAWAAHRFGRFGYIWHEQDDVQGWINLRSPIPLYAAPPSPAKEG